MRIVLDTNCLIQIISPHGKYHDVWLSLVDGQNILCISNEIIDEYVEILEKLFNHNLAEAVVKTIVNSPFVESVTPFYKFELIKADPDDNKFVDCAIAANARYIVSNDRHYDVLRNIKFPRVEVLSLIDFTKIIKSTF